MKSKSRLWVLMLIPALLCLPFGTLAEQPEDIIISTEAADEPADSSVPLPAPMPEASDIPAPDVFADITEEPSEASEGLLPVLPELTPPPAQQQEDTPLHALSSGFNHGYVKLTSAATGYASASPSAEAVIYLEKGVLYASARRASSSGDRLRVHFDDNGNTRSVWIDARRLRPMSEAEILSFVSARSESKARCYGGDRNLPLDSLDYSSVVTYNLVTQEPRLTAPAMFVDCTSLSLNAGDTLPIGVSFSDGKGCQVFYDSENSTIAAVSEDGRVTAVSAGSTCIRLRSEHGNEASVEILVNP